MSDAKQYADSLGLPTHEPSVVCGAWCQGGSVDMAPTTMPEHTSLTECWVRGDTAAAEINELKQGYESQFKEIHALRAQLAAVTRERDEARGALRSCASFAHDLLGCDLNGSVASIVDQLVDVTDRAAASAGDSQP